MRAVAKRATDVLGNVARARKRALLLQWQHSRTESLVHAIVAGTLRAPQSVLAALKGLLPAEQVDTASNSDDDQDGPKRRRHVPTPELTESDLDVLSRFLCRGNREERIGAACCIVRFAETFRMPPGFAYLSLPFYAEPHNSLTAGLEGAVRDDIPEVQRDLLKVFPHLQFGGDELLPTFVELLSSAQEEVQEVAAIAIRSLGIDRAQTARHELARMLDRPPRVAIAACETLASFGRDAALAVPPLVDCIHDTKISKETRIAATMALTTIDPEGKALSAIKNKAKRNAIIEALSHIAENGRRLRRLLPLRWAKHDKDHPAKWLSIPQIAKKIACSESTLRRSISRGRICPHEKRGTGKSTQYLVTREDVKRWRVT